jgi:hypothetical protein
MEGFGGVKGVVGHHVSFSTLIQDLSHDFRMVSLGLAGFFAPHKLRRRYFGAVKSGRAPTA